MILYRDLSEIDPSNYEKCHACNAEIDKQNDSFWKVEITKWSMKNGYGQGNFEDDYYCLRCYSDKRLNDK